MESEFEEIYRKYANDLYRFIYRLCGDEALALDIMQDTMLKAIMSIDKFNGACSVKTYLCAIAKNEYCDHLRRTKRGREVPLSDAYEIPDGENIEDRVADKEKAIRIHKALHKLDEPYREIFTLRVFAELKFSEIAAVFGQSENWARVTFYRAKKKLTEILKEDDIYE